MKKEKHVTHCEKKSTKKKFLGRKSIGFTNRLAIYLVIFLALGLIGGFILAIMSIQYNYTGQLLCWTVSFTPLGTCLSIVLGKVVDKNKAENTGGNGDGIVFASAQAKNFVREEDLEKECEIIGSANSPGI